MRYKIGDKFIVNREYEGDWFNIGDIITVTTHRSNSHDVYASGSTLEPGESWFIEKEFITPVKETRIFEVGDTVKWITESDSISSGTKGTIIGVTQGDFPYIVNWQDGNVDTYSGRSLDLFYRPDSKPFEEIEEVTESEGGALRYNKGKPQFSHLSPDFILEMAELMTKSAEKYSRQNWLKKQDIRTASDSLFRHYSAFMSGQDNDEGGSEMSHLLHIAVNAMIMWENYRQYGEEVDNRFYKTIKELMGEDL